MRRTNKSHTLHTLLIATTLVTCRYANAADVIITPVTATIDGSSTISIKYREIPATRRKDAMIGILNVGRSLGSEPLTEYYLQGPELIEDCSVKMENMAKSGEYITARWEGENAKLACNRGELIVTGTTVSTDYGIQTYLVTNAEPLSPGRYAAIIKLSESHF